MTFRRINNFLITAIVAVNVYVIALPLYTIANFWWQNHAQHQPQKLAQLVKTLPEHPDLAQGERLIIPSIALNQPVVEGKSIYTVNKGVWHYPMGASPGQTGNTVFIGHRFTYNGPSVFAHLDLVKRGDNIALIWNGQRFSYTVSDIKIVEPWDTSIVKPTTDKRITVYTCTPMWTSKFRLAVIAEQDQR